MKTAGIYIHIPFCEYKCNYCDYYCLEERDHDMGVFIKMLQREIELSAKDPKKDWIFNTIYFGGGSPALLSSKSINDILHQLKNSRPSVSRNLPLPPQKLLLPQDVDAFLKLVRHQGNAYKCPHSFQLYSFFHVSCV